MRWFLGQEQTYRVFSTDNEEKLGDGLETVLGFFDVISYFGNELPKWGNVCQYRAMLEATFLKFVRGNSTTHMTGLNRKKHGTVKYMDVPNKAVRDITHGLTYTNPYVDFEEASSTGQKRKAGESSNEDAADRGREPDHAEEPDVKQSRTGGVTRRAELLQLFENLCTRAGELNVCIMCGKESHEGTCRDTARATESDRMQLLFLPEGHPSSDEDIDMEGPEGEGASSEPRERSHPPEMEEPNVRPREELCKYNYAVNLPQMADMGTGGQLHVGHLDLHTNPNGSMKDYNNTLDLFGGANPSVIPQPGDEAVCKGVRGFSCMTDTLPKGMHLEVMNTQSRDTSFPYWPYKEYTAFGSTGRHDGLYPMSKALVSILRHQIGVKRGNAIPCNGGGWGEHRPHPGPRGRVPTESVQGHRRMCQIRGPESTKTEAADSRCEIRPGHRQRDDAGSDTCGMDQREHRLDSEHNGWWQPWRI